MSKEGNQIQISPSSLVEAGKDEAKIQDWESYGLDGLSDEDFEMIQDDLYGQTEEIKLDEATINKARDLILEHFMQYEPEEVLADRPHFGLIYQLDRLFYGDIWSGEATGSLGQDIVDAVLPILEDIKEKHPKYANAVVRFISLFCKQSSNEAMLNDVENTESIFNPYRNIVLKEVKTEVLEWFTSKECTPEDAVRFSLQAIHGHVNSFEGITITKHWIQELGWEGFLKQSVAIHRQGNVQGSLFAAIVEVVHILGTPADLPDEKIESLFEDARDDMEWIILDSYLALRSSTVNLEKISTQDNRYLLRDFNIPFWNEEKVKQVATKLLVEIPEVYYGLLFELRDCGYQVEMGEDPRSLVERIPSVFLFNCITNYSPHEDDYFNVTYENLGDLQDFDKGELVESLMLRDEELRGKTKDLVLENSNAFQKALFLTELATKSSNAVVLASNPYNLLGIAEEGALQEHDDEINRWGYMINSSALKLSKNITGVYSPTGRMLRMVKTPQTAEGTNLELADYVSMSHVLSDVTNFDLEENATAVLLIFWNRLPAQWQDHIEEYFWSCDIDIKEWVNQSPDSLELAVAFSSDIVPIVRSMKAFPEALQKHVKETLESLEKQLEYPDEIDSNELLILINTEYNKSDFTEKEVDEIKQQLTFNTVKFLQDAFKIDFGELKRRELFSLLRYLKQNKNGEGFKKLKEIAETAGDDKDAVLSRIRVFMSLEYGNKEQGDNIVAFAKENKNAEKIFNYYSSLLDSADRAEDLVEQSTQYNNRERDIIVKMLGMRQDTQKLAEKIPSFFEKKNKELTDNIRDNLLGRAQKDLERALKAGDPLKVEELVRTYDIHAKEYVALLQEVGAGNIEKKSPSELSPEDKEVMLSLLQENYQKTYPGEEYKEFRDMVQEALQKSFTDPNATFRILRDKGKIVSFNRFDSVTEPEGEEKTYFGSFNADPAYSGVGSVMLEKTIQERLKDGRCMVGNCDTNQPITKKYIESGFIATSFFTAPSGIPAFEIQRTQDSATRFKTKTMTIEELLTRADTFYTVRKQEVEETYPEIRKGKVLTRLFEHNKEMYVVFEEVV